MSKDVKWPKKWLIFSLLAMFVILPIRFVGRMHPPRWWIVQAMDVQLIAGAVQYYEKEYGVTGLNVGHLKLAPKYSGCTSGAFHLPYTSATIFTKFTFSPSTTRVGVRVTGSRASRVDLHFYRKILRSAARTFATLSHPVHVAFP